jgi:23S rRNA U2552 (ribose-2'-O)-methylase RlmE/FtsJ
MNNHKLVYHIDCRSQNEEKVPTELWDINTALHAQLKSHKDQITTHHSNRSWDFYKKMSNEYEFVFTSNTDLPSSSPYTPVSRSFFKLWEMLHDFEDQICHKQHMHVAFLAEGPGGFVEAFFRFRKMRNPDSRDMLIGMTLHSSDRRVPAWRLTPDIHSNITICLGEDGTGNIYNPKNILAMVKTTGGYNKCDLITADGGFDFSYDFNNQESMSLKLICSEVYAALCMQNNGGTFILKIYDASSPSTISLINILSKIYSDIYVLKPLTSRPANSEKYMICQNFDISKADKMRNMLLSSLSCEYIDDTLIQMNTTWLIKHVINFNHYFVTRQIMYIIKTIVCINLAQKEQLPIKKITELHQHMSLSWCIKYGIIQSSETDSCLFETQTNDLKN